MGMLRRYSWAAGFVLLPAGLAVFLWVPEQRAWGAALMTAGAFLVAVGTALNLGDLASLLRGRGVRYGANAVLYSLLVLLIVAAVNFLASRHRARMDLTEGEIHTLSPQTISILDGLDQEVEVIGFFTESSLDRRTAFEDLAAEYAHRTPRFRMRLVDPLRSPGEARLHEISQDGTVVIKAASGEGRLTTVGEQDLTNALLKATKGRQPTACFTIGHGEFSTADAGTSGYRQAADALRQDNFKVQEVLLLREGRVPEECALVVVAGPATPLHAAEAGQIERYLASGGRLMVLKRDPGAVTGLESLLEPYGLKVHQDTVVDRLSRAILGDEFTPVVTNYHAHPITRALGERGMATCFPVASSVEAIHPTQEGITSILVARTTEAAWGETSKTVGFEAGVDHAGPVGLVAAASGALPGAGGSPGGENGGKQATAAADSGEAPEEADGGRLERRIVLVGDGDFASNSYLRAGFANADLFMNAAAWLAEEEDLISIRPAPKQPRPITLTENRANLLSGMTYLTPVIAFLGAAIVWSRRRKL